MNSLAVESKLVRSISDAEPSSPAKNRESDETFAQKINQQPERNGYGQFDSNQGRLRIFQRQDDL